MVDFLSRPAVIKSPPRERRQEVRSFSYNYFVYGEVARNSSRMKSCRPKFLVKSPEMLSYVARNFIKLKNILAFFLRIYRACFVSLKIKERVILLIYRACLVVHRGLEPCEIYYTQWLIIYRLFCLIIA